MPRATLQPDETLIYGSQHWRIDRQLPDSQWQIEQLSTGRMAQVSHQQLLNDYTSGRMRFLVEHSAHLPIANATGIVQRHDLGTDNRTLSDTGAERARIRYTYVSKLLAEADFKASVEWLKPRIHEIWDRIKAPNAESPPHPTTVLRWIKKYQNSDHDARALANNWQRKPYGPHYEDPRLTELIETAVNDVYLTRERRSITDTLERARLHVDQENTFRDHPYKLPHPTYYRVHRAIKERPAFDVYRARYGNDAARRAFRSVEGSLVTDRPLEVVAIDHTPLDVVALDDYLGIPIGRPTLAVCADEYSRVPLGFYLGFEPPGTVSLASCLLHSLLPKVHLQETYPEVVNDWPCHGVMETLLIDNGLENHGRMLESACLSLGCGLQFQPRKTPWYKGKIERFLQEINHKIAHGLPGTTYANIFQKGDYQPEKNAAIRLSTLRHIVTIWLVDIFMRKPHSQIGTTPLAKWELGLGNMPVPLAPDPQSLEAFFTRPETRNLDHRGVSYDRILYNSPELQALRTQHGPKLQVTIRIHDADISHIYVVDPKTKELIEVPAVNQDYTRGLSRWSHKAIIRFAKSELSCADDKSLREARARIDALIAQDTQQRKKRTAKRVGRYLDRAGPSADTVGPASDRPPSSDAADSPDLDELPDESMPPGGPEDLSPLADDDLTPIIERRRPIARGIEGDD